MATTVGTVAIDVDVGTAKLEEGWNRANSISRREAAKLQAQAAALGTAIGTTIGNGISAGISGLINQAKKGIDALDQLASASEQFGVSSQTLAALRRETTLAGGSFDQMSTGLKALSVAASSNNAVFKAMGLSVKDGAGNLKSTETLLGEVTAKFAGYQDGAAKAALAQRLFGDAGVTLLPVLNQIGREGLDGITDKARQAGAVLGEDAAAGAKQFKDDLHALRVSGEDFSQQLAVELLPTLHQLAQLVQDPGFQSAMEKIAEAIGAAAREAVDATEEITKLYNRASGGVGVSVFNNGVNTGADREAAERELAQLQRIKQQGGAADVLSDLLNAWNPGEIASATSAVFHGTGARNDARQAELRAQLATYARERPTFPGVESKYVGTVAADPLAAAPMIPQKTPDRSGALASAAKAQQDAQRRLADLTERLQGQVAGPAAQAWDSYAKSVRDAADAGAKQIEAAQKQVALGDKTVDVAKVTVNAQNQVAVAVNAARAAWEQYRKDADKAFDNEMADVEASIARPTKAMTEQAQALRNFQRATDSLFDRREKGQITEQQYATGLAEYQKQLDARRAEIERATDDMSQFALQAARNTQDAMADTFYSMYTDIDKGLDGIAESWGQMILKMLSQAQAAQLGKALFGDYGNTGSIGGIVGGVLGSIGGAPQNPSTTYNDKGFVSHVSFGGGRAVGGPTSGGTMYEVAERGPELYREAGRTYLLSGKDGHVTPATAGSDSRLGERMASAIQPAMGLQLTINNNAPTRVTTRQGQSSGGQMNLEVMIDLIDQGLADRNDAGRSRFGASQARRTGTSMAAGL